MIVEIGANDGKVGDPLFHLINSRPDCHALLVEPIPYLFEQLKSNYRGRARCTFENVAISPGSGPMTLHFIDPSARELGSHIPPYFEELASVNQKSILATVGVGNEAYVRQLNVQTITLDALFLKHAITYVDVLQIDTEGFDYEVLKTMPFDRIRPVLICFEHCHLSDLDRANAVNLVKRQGYRVERWGKDFICVGRSRRPQYTVTAN